MLFQHCTSQLLCILRACSIIFMSCRYLAVLISMISQCVNEVDHRKWQKPCCGVHSRARPALCDSVVLSSRYALVYVCTLFFNVHSCVLLGMAQASADTATIVSSSDLFSSMYMGVFVFKHYSLCWLFGVLKLLVSGYCEYSTLSKDWHCRWRAHVACVLRVRQRQCFERMHTL